MKYTVIDTFEATYILDSNNITEEEIQKAAVEMAAFAKNALQADDVVHTRHQVFVHDEEASA